MQVQETILQQLGGRKFIAMTGASCYADGENTLVVKFKGSQKANIMYVTLNGLDLYDVKIAKYSGLNVKTIDETENADAEMLAPLFTKVTGLYTSI